MGAYGAPPERRPLAAPGGGISWSDSSAATSQHLAREGGARHLHLQLGVSLWAQCPPFPLGQHAAGVPCSMPSVSSWPAGGRRVVITAVPQAFEANRVSHSNGYMF